MVASLGYLVALNEIWPEMNESGYMIFGLSLKVWSFAVESVFLPVYSGEDSRPYGSNIVAWIN